jgi:MurNAc alpha-1-phosphate uridylyltransferase
MEPSATPAGQESRSDLVGVVLAAGSARRLLPLSDLRPKALCPVGNRALVDCALDRLAPVVGGLGVNLHHHVDLLSEHLHREWGSQVWQSIERTEAMGTAGGIARMRRWIDGRGVLVVNADAWSPSDLSPLVDGWNNETIRVMVQGVAEFGPKAKIVASTLPWSVVAQLEERPTGLFEVVWRDAFSRGELEVIGHDGVFHDCGTPLDYLLANLDAVALHGESIVSDDATIESDAELVNCVIGAGAHIAGDVSSSVVWSGQSVGADERLIRSIRAGTSVTVGPL